MQIDPIKPKLKAPGYTRLKLRYDEPPSNFAFKFKLRLYMKVKPFGPAFDGKSSEGDVFDYGNGTYLAGACTRSR